MSGPTPNAYPPLFTWATLETNYPAGANPWNGQPVLVAPVGDIFTPNTKPPAQNMNYVLNKGTAGNDTSILQATALAQVQNWIVGAFSSSLGGGANPITNVDSVAYDPVNDLVMIGGRATSIGPNGGMAFAVRGDAIDPFAQPGGGNLNLASGIQSVPSVLKDPTDAVTYYVAMMITGGSGVFVYRVVTSPASTTLIYNPVPLPLTTDVKLGYLNGHLIVCIADSGAPSNSYIVSISNPKTTGETQDTNTRFLVPATYFNVATNAAANQFIAIGGSTTTPTETTSPDGINFTTQTAGFSGQVPGGGVGVPFGVTWGSDSSGSAWFVGMARSDTSKARWLRSADGVTWTTTTGQIAFANWTLALGQQPNLVSIGGLLASLAKDPGGNLRALYSYDGASTWWAAPFRSSISASPLSLAAGSNRLIACAGPSSVWVSSAQGVSTLQAQ